MPRMRVGRASIASGAAYAMAIADDGSLWAWGTNTYGNLGDGTRTTRVTPTRVLGLSNVVAVSVGAGHSVALTSDGGVWTWGRNDRGQLEGAPGEWRNLPRRVDTITGAVAISAGANHTLALLADGTVRGWGDNSTGQVGDGSVTAVSPPVIVSGLRDVVRIAAGQFHSLALKADGTVWAWGLNDLGQLGDGTMTTRPIPARVPAIVAASIATGGALGQSVGSASYAIMADGTVWAWGDYSRAGPTQVPGYSGIVEIAAGYAFAMGRRADGTVWTHGRNNLGQLGRATSEPVGQVTSLPPIGAISAGSAYGFAVGADGTLFAWGDNTASQLGIEQVITRTTPVATSGIDSVVQVAAGAQGGFSGFSLALRSDGSVWAWGRDIFGELGQREDIGQSSLPLAISGISQVIQVAAGQQHSAALRSDGTVWTWGGNAYGQLGRSTGQPSLAPPAMVEGLSDVTAISAGALHMVAVRRDGSVWSWGNNGAGQLGVVSSEHCLFFAEPEPCTTRPVQVPGLSNVAQVAAGAAHTLALRADGTVWAWGDNRRGALGDGTTTSRSSPAPVPGLTDVISIAAGGRLCEPNCGQAHSVALKRDGTVWTWGANDYGQLGGTPRQTLLTPQRVPELSAVTYITAAGERSGALRSDGTVWMWGGNLDGALGDGTLADRTHPALVLRESGAGSLESDDWFLDLDPSIAAAVAVDKSFPVVATGSVSGNTASVIADIGFRSRDFGSFGGVYVFALAPANLVRNAAADPALPLRLTAKGSGKDAPPQCVLAQLNAIGQLVAASLVNLQAYTTGVLSAQGQGVNIINGVPTSTIGGATFFVGYGSSAGAMVNGGTNRSVATIPGAVQCQPQPPQTGWWWNPLEDGRGFSIERRGNNLFFASFLYDISGRSTWHVSAGPVSLEGSLYMGDLLSARSGQTLGGVYPGFPALRSEGPITLAFETAGTGTMVWPGGTVPIQRFNIVPNGLNLPPAANQPESGWWWNEQEAGRGFFMEWQGGTLDIAGYMYDDEGNPVWYLTVGDMTGEGRNFSGNWWSYGNGQTLTGPWRPNARLSTNVAPVTIQFSAPDAALMTLPNGRTTSLRRHRF